MEVPRSGLIRIRVRRDLFPSEGLNVEHVDVCDHPPFCDEAATLDERRVRTGFVQYGEELAIHIDKPWNRRPW